MTPPATLFDAQRPAHRRYDPLRGEWILVSPQRAERPWLGHTERAEVGPRIEHDPACALCPGNLRAGGARNPLYEGTFAFENDFPALLPEVAAGDADLAGAGADAGDLFRSAGARGTCRVICYSHRHDLELAEMPVRDILRVVEAWASAAAELGARFRWVQVFENKGEAAGCSNPHPHCQVWASDFLPSRPAVEDRLQREYRDRRGGAGELLTDYLDAELERRVRVVHATAHWVAVVPYWAVWPFETLLLPRRRVARLCDLTAPERLDLASFLSAVLGGYDRLFSVSFPYSLGWHGAPFDDAPGGHDHWQLHAHVYPPLLRSATVRKFMVGYELLAEAQRDLTPELAAARLRAAVSTTC